MVMQRAKTEKSTMIEVEVGQPKVGDIVNFLAEGGETLPAIVTKADKAVNLRLFTNNSQNQYAPLLENVEQGKKEKQWSFRDGE